MILTPTMRSTRQFQHRLNKASRAFLVRLTPCIVIKPRTAYLKSGHLKSLAFFGRRSGDVCGSDLRVGNLDIVVAPPQPSSRVFSHSPSS